MGYISLEPFALEPGCWNFCALAHHYASYEAPTWVSSSDISGKGWNFRLNYTDNSSEDEYIAYYDVEVPNSVSEGMHTIWIEYGEYGTGINIQVHFEVAYPSITFWANFFATSDSAWQSVEAVEGQDYSASAPTLAGYTFAGWLSKKTLALDDLGDLWNSGTRTMGTSDINWYAVWRKDDGTRSTTSSLSHTFKSVSSSTYATASSTLTVNYTAVPKYYTYTRGSSVTSTEGGSESSRNGSAISLPTTPTNGYGHTFKGWTPTASSTSPSWTSGTVTPIINTTYYAVWYGDIVTAGDQSSSVSTYGSTITATKYASSSTATATYSAYRQTYYKYDTGYYNQNHNYNLSYHSGTTSNKTSATYYRLNNNGTTTDWSTSAPSLKLTVPYTTASLDGGYTWAGWTTSSTGTSATWTSGNKDVTANTTFYGTWTDANGTRSTTDTLTHSFYATSTTKYDTKTTTKTTNYKSVTRYFNYTRGTSTTATSGGTVDTTTYTAVTKPTEPSLNGYAFVGWATSATATTSAWKDTAPKPTSSTSYYAVWSNTSGTHTDSQAGSLTHTFYKTSSSDITQVTTKYDKVYTGDTVYYNYLLSTSRNAGGGSHTSSTNYGTLTAPSASKTGYTFAAWSANGTTTGATVPANPTTAQTFYAIWKRTGNLVGNYSSSTVNGTTGTGYCAYNGSISSISCALPAAQTKDGYTWVGWSNSSTISASPSILSGNQAVTASAASGNTKNIYAVWKKTDGTHTAAGSFTHTFYISSSTDKTTATTSYTKNYTGDTVYYNYNAGSSANTQNGTHTSSSGYGALTVPTVSRTGYTFHGWSASGTSTTTTTPTANPTSALTYYAVWKRTAKVVGNYSSSTLDGTTGTGYCVYNGTISTVSAALPGTPTAPATGDTFYGWCSSNAPASSTASAPTILSGSQSVSVSDTTGSLTVYAVWKRTDGTHSTTGNTGTITHTFYKTSSTDKSNPTTSYTYTKNFTGDTVYYNYNKSVSANQKNSSTFTTSNYSYDNLAYPSDPGRTGYSFCGWTNASTGTAAKWTSGAKTVSSTTGQVWYAVWSDTSGTRNATSTITHTFYAPNATTSYTTVNSTRTVPYTGVTKYFSYDLGHNTTATSGGTAGTAYGSAISLPTAPTNGSYTFKGWSTTANSATVNWSTGTKSPASATSYYAVWSGAVSVGASSLSYTSGNSATVAIPTANSPTYDGTSKTPTWTYDSTKCKIQDGTESATNVSATYYSRQAVLLGTAYFASGNKTTTASGSGTLSVASSDTSVATVAISNGTITVTCLKAGSATITVTAAASNNYQSASTTISISSANGSYVWTDNTAADKGVNWNLTKRALTVTATNQSKAYDGSKLSADNSISASGQVSGHTVTATCSGSTSAATAGSTGTKSVSTVTVKSGTTDVTGNYNITKNSGTLSIVRASGSITLDISDMNYTSANSADVATPTQSGSLTYNGSSQTPSWSYNSSYCSISGGTASAIDVPVTADSITKSSYSRTASLTNAAYFATTSKNRTVSGTGTLSVSSNNTNVATVGLNTTGDSVQVSIVGAGSATITVSAAQSTNYNATSTSFTVTSVAGKHIWSDSTTANKTIYWTMNKASQSAPSAAGATATYPNTATATYTHGTTHVGALTWTNGSSRSAIGSQSTRAYYAETRNYSESAKSGAVTLTVEKATQTVTFSAAPTPITYGNSGTATASAKVNAGSQSAGAITYSSSNTAAATINSSSGAITTVKPGSTTITATAAETDYYKSASATYTLTVSKASSSITVSATSATKTPGDTCDVSGYVTAKNPNVTLSYAITTNGTTTASTLSGSTVTCGAMSASNDNNQSVVVTITNPGNDYYASSTKAFTITVQKKAQTAPVLQGDSKVYTENVTASASVKTAGTAAGTLTWSPSQSRTASQGVGTTSVTAYYARTTVYAQSPNATAVDVSITQRTVTAVVPTIATGREWSNSALATSTGGSVTAGGTMYYYQNTTGTAPTTFSTSTWTTTRPSATDINTYYVWAYAYVSDTTNNKASTNTNTIKSVGSHTISKRTITLTWGTKSWTYTGTAHETTCTVGNTVSGVACTISLAGNSITNVSETGKTVTASIATGGTYYRLPSTYTTTLTVTAVALGAIASASNATYSGKPQIPTPTVTATVNVASKTLVKDTDYTLTYSNNTNVGTATVTATGKGNYSGTKSTTWSITKKELTVTGSSHTVTYGDNAPTLSVSYSGFVNNETASVLTTAPTASTTYTKTTTVASSPVDVTVSGGAATNYSFTYVKGKITINKKQLTVTASSHTITYGAAVPSMSVTYSGWVNNEGTTALTTAPTVSTTYTAGADVGGYDTTASGGVAANYSFKYVSGTITVGKGTGSGSVTVANWKYGQTASNPVPVSSTNGTSNVTYTWYNSSKTALSSRPTATSDVGTYYVKATFAATQNYNAVTTDYALFSITLGVQTVSFSAEGKPGESTSIKYGTSATAIAAATKSGSGTSTVGAITFSSSDTSVATIDSTTGTITAVKPGSTTITASVAATSYYAATSTNYTCKVAKNDQSISFTKAPTPITYGNSATATVSTSRSGSGTASLGAVTFASSNTAVATINSSTGAITPVASGTTTITASIAATTYYNANSATYTLTINKANASVTLSATSGTITYPATSLTFTASHTGNASSWNAPALNPTTVATASAVDSTGKVTVTRKENGYGSATITVSIPATSQYNAASATYTITYARATNAFALSGVTTTYNSNAALATVTTTSSEGSVYYAEGTVLTSSNYSTAGSTTIPTANSSRNASTTAYKIYYYIPQGTNYLAKSGNVSATINKATPTLSISGTGTYTYGSARSIKVTVSPAIKGTLYYGATSSYGSSVAVAAGAANTVVGSITNVADSPLKRYVYFAPDDTTNYNNSAGSGEKSITINAAASTLPTTWQGDSKDFHKTATVTATGYAGGTIYYRTSTTSGSSYSSWTTTVPTRTAVGTTYVQCYIKGDSNHNDSSASSEVSITINKVDDAAITLTLGSNLTYNGAGQTVVSASNAHGIKNYYIGYGASSTSAPSSWTADTATMTQTNAGDYYVWYKFTADDSHSTVKNATYVGKVTISKKSVTVSLGNSGTSFVYGGTAVTYNKSASGVISGHTATITVNNAPSSLSAAKSYSVTTTTTIASGSTNVTSNYSISEASATITVTQRPIAVTATANAGCTYNGSAQYYCTTGSVSNVPTGGTSGGTFKYCTTSSGTYSTTRPTQTDAGTYKLYWTFDVGANYYINGQETTVRSISGNTTGTIAKKAATITVSANKTSYTYGDTAAVCSVSTSGLVASTDLGTVSVSGAPASRSSVGSYTVTASYTANSNYDVTINTKSISVGARAITITGGTTSKAYDGTQLTYNYATITSGSLATGDTGTLTAVNGTANKPVNVNDGNITNIPSIAIVNENKASMNSNYSITKVNGTLTITKSEAALKLGGTSSTSNPGAQVNIASLVQDHTGTVTFAFKSNGTTTASTISSGVVTCGAMSSSDDNNQTVTVNVTDPGDSNHNSKTIVYTITVAKYTPTISFSNSTASVTYGSTLSVAATVSASGGTCGTLSYATTGNYTSISGSTITGTAYSNADSDTITASVSRTTTVKAGSKTRSVKVAQRSTTVTGNSNSKAYDNTNLTVSGCTATNLLSGHTASCSGSATQKEPGSSSFTPSSIVIKNSSNVDVTANYAITAKAGTATITKANPIITMTNKQTWIGRTVSASPTISLPGGQTQGETTYTSSATAKATVDASTGVITGVAKGTSTITISIAATTYYNAATASITATIKDRYTVQYNANGGSGTTSAQYKYEDEALTLRANGYSRTGYSSTKWNTAAAGTGTDYAFSGNYTSNTAATLYAQWSINNYTVTYYIASGTTKAVSVTYNDSFTFPAQDTTYTRSGYTLAGWSDDNNTSVEHSCGATATMGASNAVYYAVWKRTAKLVGYYNTSTVNGTTAESSCKYDGTISSISCNLPASTGVTKTGYSFVGWSKNSTDTSTNNIYSGAQTVTLGSGTNTDKAVYAVWSNTVTLSYTTTYGTAPANQTATRYYNYNASSCGSVSFTLAATMSVKEHYCLGWTIDSNNYAGSTKYTNSNAETSISAVATWHDQGAWIYDGTEWKRVTSYYVYKDGAWKEIYPTVYTGNTWKNSK